MTDFIVHVQVDPMVIATRSPRAYIPGVNSVWDYPPIRIDVRAQRAFIRIQELSLFRTYVRCTNCTDGGGGGEPQRPESGIVWP